MQDVPLEAGQAAALQLATIDAQQSCRIQQQQTALGLLPPLLQQLLVLLLLLLQPAKCTQA